jgi:DNA polymerase elongation subunit (family B)
MKPRILIFDIETAPNLAYVWGKYEQDVIAFKSEWHLLSFAYKWLGDKNVQCETMQGQVDDKKLVKKLHRLFDQADVVIAHNGDAFDIKKVRARFAFHGLKPPSQFATVDTLKVVKRYFNLNSNRLNDLGIYFKLGEKVKHTGFDLWLGCLKNNKKSWKQLRKYNKQDVVLLEKVYKKLLPWMDRHPNVAALRDVKGCTKCGSTRIVKDGVRANANTLQQQWKCKDCHGYFLTRRSK